MAGNTLNGGDQLVLANAFGSEMRDNMKSIFPNWANRVRAYGKLVLTPVFKHPLESLAGDFEQSPKYEQFISDTVQGVAKWALDGDRCAPEFRPRLEAIVAQETPAETV